MKYAAPRVIHICIVESVATYRLFNTRLKYISSDYIIIKPFITDIIPEVMGPGKRDFFCVKICIKKN